MNARTFTITNTATGADIAPGDVLPSNVDGTPTVWMFQRLHTFPGRETAMFSCRNVETGRQTTIAAASFGVTITETTPADDAKPEPTNPDNAGERRELGALIAELANDDYVTTTEAADVLAWCREWLADVDTETVWDGYTDAHVLRACQRQIDGGIRFVLDDVRRCATAKPAEDDEPAMPSEALYAPLRVVREHSGTEDGYLYYVVREDGTRAEDAGHVHELSAACDAVTLAAELRGFTVWQADGPRWAECVSAAVTHAIVTGSIGATYMMDDDAPSTAKVRRTDKGAPEGHTITVPAPGACTCNVPGVHGFGPHLPGCPAKPAERAPGDDVTLGELRAKPAPWADLPQSTRDGYAARWAREAYAPDVPELVTDAQALTLVALAEHVGEAWQCAPSVSVDRHGTNGDIVAIFTADSPAPNPVVRLWAGGDSYSALNAADYVHYLPRLRAEHGRVIVQRADDSAYVIAPGGTYEPLASVPDSWAGR